MVHVHGLVRIKRINANAMSFMKVLFVKIRLIFAKMRHVILMEYVKTLKIRLNANV